MTGTARCPVRLGQGGIATPGGAGDASPAGGVKASGGRGARAPSSAATGCLVHLPLRPKKIRGLDLGASIITQVPDREAVYV
jgi:hypothetical protein